MITPQTTTRRRIAVTIARRTPSGSLGSRRTVCCLSPSYSAAVGTVLAAFNPTPGTSDRAVVVLAIGERPERDDGLLRRAEWPLGLDARAARTVATELDVNCDDALARP